MPNTIAASPGITLSRLTFKSFLLGSLQVLCLLCLFAQIAINDQLDNVVSVVLVVLSSSLLIQYLWRSQAMATHPLSSLALLGFTASSQLVALLTQTGSWAPFTQYLRAPVLTFSVLATVHVTAVLAHFVFRHFAPLRHASQFIAEKIYGPLNLHRIPTPDTLWVLSIIGLVAFVFGGGEFGDVGGKFLAAFSFMVWMPFLIILYRDILGPSYCDLKRQLPFIVLFGLLVMALAVIRNYRAMIFIGPIQLAFVYLIHKCHRPTPISSTSLKVGCGFIVAGALLMPVLADLVTSMEMVRMYRERSTPAEMLKETFETFLDKQRIQQYRDSSAIAPIVMMYDEKYLGNPLLNRLSETKFHDNMIYFGSQFGDKDRADLIDYQIAKIIYIVPQNVLDFLEVKFDKNKYFYSTGDFYINQHHGGMLGGFVTGSIWADAYVISGYWLPFFVFGLLLLVFIPMDALSRFGPGYFVSPAALCSTWSLFLYGIGAESIAVKVNHLTRGAIQLPFLYAITLFSVVFVVHLFGRTAFARSSASQ